LYFNNVYKAFGTTYGINTVRYSSITLLTGSGFSFTSDVASNPTFNNGNNQNGILTYFTANGNLITIYGIVSRKSKVNNDTTAINFIPTDASYSVVTGEAYLLVIPGYESLFTNGDTVKTDSSEIELNDLLEIQQEHSTLKISNTSVLVNAGYAVFNVSLTSPATTNVTFTPTLTGVSAVSGIDFGNSMQYLNGSSWITISSSVSIPAGTTSKQIRVPILNFNTSSNDKTFTLNTGIVSGGVVNNYGNNGTCTIVVPKIQTSGVLNSFSSCQSTASSSQNFSISASNLISNLIVTAPNGYEISLNSTGTYSGTLSINPVSNIVNTTIVYARLSASAVSGMSGNFVISSNAAVSKTISVSAASITAPTLTLQNATINSCYSNVNQSVSYFYNITSGSPSTYSLTWNTTPTNSFINKTNITLTSNSIAVTIPSGTLVGTYNATLTVKSTSGCSSIAYPISTVINASSNGGVVTTSQTICAGSNPSNISISGQIGTVLKWQSASDTNFTNPVNIASSSATLNGSEIGVINSTTYFRAIVQNGACSSVYSDFSAVSIGTTVWNGSNWSNGEPNDPTITKAIVFTGNYSCSVNLYGCTMWVTNGANVVLNTGYNITTIGAISVDPGSTFVMENDSNVLQMTDAVNNGIVTVNRKSSPLFRLDYTLWSSPVSGTQKLFDFSPLTSNVLPNNRRFYTYNTTSNLYTMVDPLQTNFSVGKGYLIRMPNNWISFNGPNSLTPGTNQPERFDGNFIGNLNNGTINVTGLVDGGSTALRYNTVGNPYPSTIQIPDFISQNQNNIEGSIWLWRKTNDMYNMTSYSTCTVAGCTRNNGHTFYFDDNLISVGQGFMVKVKPNKSSIVFTNSMRRGENVDQFFRTTEKNRFWMDLTSSSGVKFGQYMLAYIPNATNGYDNGYDGVYFNDSQTALTSIVNGNELTINAKSNFNVNDITPLQFRTDSGDSYTISINRTEGVFSQNQDILIRDNQLGIIQSLKSSNYSFSSATGVFQNRFDILYQNTALSTNNSKFTENSVVVYKKDGLLNINAGSVIIDNIKVFDIRGQLLFEKKDVNAAQTTFNTNEMGSQVLIVQITSLDQIVVSKKVVN